jgi:hypothetical protein
MFSFRVESTPREHVIYLIGEIDENADFKPIPVPKLGKLVLDLGEIRHLNSLGLRTWVQWVQKMNHLSGIYLRHCSNVVVHQMNILEGFLPLGAIVESFEIPFYCSSCDTQSVVMVERGRDYLEATSDTAEKIMTPMQRPCTVCRSIAEADIIPAKHFKFLKKFSPSKSRNN